MTLNELKEKFLVNDEFRSERLESLILKALPHCVVQKNGIVEIKRLGLSGKDQVKLVLAARLIASKLDESVTEDVTAEQLAEYTGLPKNQAAARAKECFDERYAARCARGSYKARPLKAEEFLDGLAQAKNSARAS
jgi:hypothetical protein